MQSLRPCSEATLIECRDSSHHPLTLLTPASLNCEGVTEEAAAAFEGIDEEQLDDGAWGEPELDLGADEDPAGDLGDGVEGEPGEGDEEEGGWEMEVRNVSSCASAAPIKVVVNTSQSVTSGSRPKEPVNTIRLYTIFLCGVELWH